MVCENLQSWEGGERANRGDALLDGLGERWEEVLHGSDPGQEVEAKLGNRLPAQGPHHSGQVLAGI